MGKTIIMAGALVMAVGGMFWLFGHLGWPLGRLPGDIRIERERGSFYFPVVTCLVLSLGLTLLINLALRILGR